MASKKDFNRIDTGKQGNHTDTGGIFANIERGKDTFQRQTPPSVAETQERIDQMRTRGRKDCHAPRINMTFSGPNYDFIRTVAAATGNTMTGFINDMIQEYRNKPKYRDIYNRAKDFQRELKENG